MIPNTFEKHRCAVAAVLLAAASALAVLANLSVPRATALPPPARIRVLIVDGFSNHDWRLTTALIRGILGPTQLFDVSVSTAPLTKDAADWDAWRPKFAEYDVVIQTCNDIKGGPAWPSEVQRAFANFVERGGGVFVWHSANNAFADWPAYNDMIGLGWRKKDFGSAIAVDEHEHLVRIPAGEGSDTGHGARSETVVKRIGEHPIHAGLPRAWRTPDLEVYYYPRGPAQNLDVLSYGYDLRTQMNWPLEWTVRYGRGRIYTSTFGHVGKGDFQPERMRCAGVQTVMVRALLWLAGRGVSMPVPADFPTADMISIRPEIPLAPANSVGDGRTPIRVSPESAEVGAGDTRPFRPRWDLHPLMSVPDAIATQEGKAKGVRSLLLTGLPYRGQPTKFYAYLGIPAVTEGRMPAVVLVHGGGGSAFDAWVRYWNEKGYAALSVDTEGHVPVKIRAGNPGDPGWKRVDLEGSGWVGQPRRPSTAFADPQRPPEEQWLYHAVADCILSVSYLASIPGIDPTRIGIVGISMGSIVCSIVGGIDNRLAFVVSQYIGGNNDLGNVWYAIIKEHPEVMRWDPANFYRQPTGRAHWLWINSDHDKYGVPPMTSRSWRETKPNSWMCLLPTQGHGHIWVETGPNAVREIYAFADSVTRGAPPLVRILSTRGDGHMVTLTWQESVPVIKAQIIYTTSPLPLIEISGERRYDWAKVNYTVKDAVVPQPATRPDGSCQAMFQLPEGMTAGYINLIDQRGLAVSSDFMTPDPRP